MRRLTCSIPLAFLVGIAVTPTAAQTKKVHFGVTGGANFATWTGSDVGSGAKRRTGFTGGGMVTMHLSPAAAVQTGLRYSQEGTGADLGSGISGSFKVDYLRVPLYLKVGTKLQGTTPIYPHLYAGPAVGFKVRCKVEASSGSQSAEADCDDPSIQAKVKSTDFGLHFGAGVDIGHFNLGGRYELGLTSIDDSGGGADIKNSVLAVVAGYDF
jgi:hypothetical protein